MKYLLLIPVIVFLTTCGMLTRYTLISCSQTVEMHCEEIKTFVSEDLCEKFAREFNIDSNINIYYCDQKGVFQK